MMYMRVWCVLTHCYLRLASARPEQGLCVCACVGVGEVGAGKSVGGGGWGAVRRQRHA
jgi:hypothetical protein